MSDEKELLEKLRQTVQMAIPQIEIDQTKVLTDEELAELRRRWEKEKAARELAEKEGAEGLRERLKRAVSKLPPRTDLEPNP